MKNLNLQVMNLKADVKIRWNIAESISVFIKNIEAVQQALATKEIRITWNDTYTDMLKEILEVLEPAKLAVEKLSFEKCSLLQAEGILTFLLNSSNGNASELSTKFYDGLKQRIDERRQILPSSLILYLHNQEALKNKSTLKKASVKECVKLGIELAKRLVPSPSLENEDENDDDDQMSSAESMKAFLATISQTSKTTTSEKDNFKKDFDYYSRCGKRTPRLDLDKLYDALLSIQATSTQSERCFSDAGNFMTKKCIMLSDASLNVLVFLKSFFKQSSYFSDFKFVPS